MSDFEFKRNQELNPNVGKLLVKLQWLTIAIIFELIYS